MNDLCHEGYTATVAYDERDDHYVGRIQGIRSIISFHGATVAELTREFELAIDDYLAECAEEGRSERAALSHLRGEDCKRSIPGTFENRDRPLRSLHNTHILRPPDCPGGARSTP